MNLPDGFLFVVVMLLLIILVSIQFTLNMILKEIRTLKQHLSRYSGLKEDSGGVSYRE